jgi:predicted DNA-binding transcriptional regulator AlpA
MLMTREEVIRRLRISSSGLYRAVSNGVIPKPIKVLGKPLWKKEEIDRVIKKAANGTN